MSHTYDTHFMDYTAQSSRYSARTIVAKLRAVLPATSVLDVGCARGTWLDEWSKAGAADVFGVDGDYVKPEQLIVPAEKFRAADLSRPIDLGRRFDLVQSLEVAEHVSAASADTFVDNLVNHASGAILFSAAPPGQGGEFHVNEQPYAYWRERFRRHGYEPYDFIRPLIAGDAGVSFWYRYNVVLYLSGARAAALPEAVRATRVDDAAPIADNSPALFKLRKLAVRALPFGVQQMLARLKARLQSTSSH
jgi:SAM-dependent methyltransferase